MKVYPYIFSAAIGIAAVGTTATIAPTYFDSETQGVPLEDSKTDGPSEEMPREEPAEPIDNEWYSPVPQFPALDLSIADGLGGQFIPDEDEVKRGAFSVANLNDSDNDGKVDKDDSDVEKDPDLIKVTVHSLLKKVNAQTFMIEVSKNIRLWDSEDKGTEIKKRQFPITDLPKEFYLEGTQYSSSVRGDYFKATCDGHSDEAKVTFVWAKYSAHRNKKGQGLWKDCATKKVEKVIDGEVSEVSEVDKDHRLAKAFQDQCKGSFGPSSLPDPDKPRIGMAIGFEFTVLPTDVGKEKWVKFDVSRQRENYSFNDVGAAEDMSFPKNDRPNDDPGDEKGDPHDEDNTPENDHIYSIDKPQLTTGLIKPGVRYQYSVMQANFKEYVRVRFDGKAFDTVDIGSRCSLKTNWYCRFVAILNRVDNTGKNDFYSFASTKDKRFIAYQPFGCELGHKKIYRKRLP